MGFISADRNPRVKARVASEMIECQKETLSCSTEVELEVAETSQAKEKKEKKPRSPWEVSLNRAELQQRLIPSGCCGSRIKQLPYNIFHRQRTRSKSKGAALLRYLYEPSPVMMAALLLLSSRIPRF